MADIRPFRGLRYNLDRVDRLEDVVMVPYAVVDPDSMRRLRERSEWNMAHVDISTSDLPQEQAADRHSEAAARLARWRRESILQRDESPHFYAYRQHFALNGTTVTRQGFIGLLRLADFEEKVVLPHERTLRGPVEDRLGLLQRNRTQLSQIMLLHRDRGGAVKRCLDEAFERGRAMQAVGDDDVTHELLPMSDPKCLTALREQLAPLQVLIADGHHRYATSLAYRDEMRRMYPDAGPDAPWEFVAAFLASADDDALEVQPTHRLLRSLGDTKTADFLERLGRWYEVEAMDTEAVREPTIPGVGEGLVLLASDEHGALQGWRLLPRDEIMRATLQEAGGAEACLDVPATMLHEYVLPDVFGVPVEEQAATDRIRFVRRGRDCVNALIAGEARFALILPGTPIEAIISLSNEGFFMPQKSTFFFPKVLSGLVLYPHDGD